MAKVDLDYSDTIIYKIVCKDPLITSVYVGHTTNYVQRKYSHKQTCNNIKSPHYNLKLYKTIRAHGNWSNWNMSIINFYNCKDLLEARQKEQEHFVLLGATLNTIEPCGKHLQSPTTIIEPIAAINIVLDKKTTNKFDCNSCNCHTNKKSNYNQHMLSEKHTQCASFIQSNTFKCLNCGHQYANRSGLWKHSSKCIQNNNTQNFINVLNQNHKQNQDINSFLMEQNNKLIEQNNKLMEMLQSNKLNVS